MGDGPNRALLGKPLTTARGHVHKVEGVRTLATFHPRFLLDRPSNKALAWRDLLLLMRILLAVPLLLLGACQVSKDDNSTTVSFNQDVAENAAEDIGNTAENIGGMIANDVDTTADKVKNEVGDVDVDVNVSRDKDTHDGNHQ